MLAKSSCCTAAGAFSASATSFRALRHALRASACALRSVSGTARKAAFALRSVCLRAAALLLGFVVVRLAGFLGSGST